MPAPASFAPFIPWARFALTGKPFAKIGGSEATDFEFKETVAFVGPSAFATALYVLPASCRESFGNYEAGSADEAAFNEAIGAYIACRFLASPAGRDYFNGITEVKTADVTEKFAGQTLDALITRCGDAGQNALNRLSCVVEANRAAAPVSLVSFEGRPRSCRDARYGRYGSESDRH